MGEMGVVIVQGMRGDAIGERSGARRYLATGADQARRRAPVFVKHQVADHAACGLVDAGKGNHAAIEERQIGHDAGRMRNIGLRHGCKGAKAIHRGGLHSVNPTKKKGPRKLVLP